MKSAGILTGAVWLSLSVSNESTLERPNAEGEMARPAEICRGVGEKLAASQHGFLTDSKEQPFYF